MKMCSSKLPIFGKTVNACLKIHDRNFSDNVVLDLNETYGGRRISCILSLRETAYVAFSFICSWNLQRAQKSNEWDNLFSQLLFKAIFLLLNEMFLDTTRHFLKTCFDRNLCHLQFKIQSI